ncbi:hypothetical protein KGY73_00815 [bacterium]|nr:hypothetical protein [bacterium]
MKRLISTFLRYKLSLLAFGLLLTFFSSFGQTFLISLYVPSIEELLNISNTEFGTIYTELSAHLNLRIIKGLSLNIRSSYSLINDQVAIPKADLSLEEILLEQRRRTTSYEFSANIGLSYTFGSRITGVFNPRLDLE